MRRSTGSARNGGYGVIEILVALTLIVVAVVLTGRVIITTLALVGGGTRDYQRAARVRTQATEWVQAAAEYTQKLGFAEVVSRCGASPCVVPPGDPPVGASAPFDVGPALPQGFQCGRIRLSDWDGPGGFDPATLRLITIELYRGGADCSDLGPTPFATAYTGVAAR
jgi:hypothetical protein